jgi:hypothetical protein
MAESRDRTRVVFEHRHLERYGEQAERMRAILDRPQADEAVLASIPRRCDNLEDQTAWQSGLSGDDERARTP